MDKFWTPICNGKLKHSERFVTFTAFIWNGMFSHSIPLHFSYYLWCASFNGVSVLENCDLFIFNKKSVCEI